MTDRHIENRQHIRFRRLDFERSRNKRGHPNNPPNRNRPQYSAELQNQVNVLQREFVEIRRIMPPEFDPALIFKVVTESTIDENDWRRSGLTLLSEEPGNVVILFSPDQLAEFSNRIGIFGEEQRDGLPAYSWIASVTTEMALWGRENRTGRKLKGIEIEQDQTYTLDVELWSYGTRDEIDNRMEELRHFVINNGGQFLDLFVNTSLSIARVKLNGVTLDRLLDVGIVQSVDLPPAPDLQTGLLINVPLDEFPNPPGPPQEGAEGICIIDSGITTGHPMLQTAVGETVAIPTRLGSGFDEHGHGTMVAGIALYGDVAACINNLDFTPQFYIFGARVTNANNEFDDERLIISQMDEAVRYFHDNYGCRVFNISLADPQLVFDGSKPSPWAQILDTLARELNIIIVVSTGNYPVVGINGNAADQKRIGYPGYLLDPDARILEPATAANAITVGAISHCENAEMFGRYPNDPAYQCIALTSQPSPFTRSGPGVNDAIKPDVCEYGGNILWDGRTHVLIRDRGLSIVSMNREFTSRLFTVDVGTSYAAPRVAHLAAQILNNYRGLSANLVRALIANSAELPVAGLDQLNMDDLLRLYGYGRPNLEKALFSTDNRVTLMAEDTILVDTFHIYQIPIPEEFKDTRGRRRISISLAFDPPVRHTRKDYLGIKMDFYLVRGLPLERVVEYYESRPKDIEIPNLENRYKCDLEPSITRRSGGTLQRATFTASTNRTLTNYEGDNYFLVLRCKASNWISPDEHDRQNYGLTATIEHLETPIELYEVIEQRVRPAQRIRV